MSGTGLRRVPVGRGRASVLLPLALALTGPAIAQEPIKIGWLPALTGPTILGLDRGGQGRTVCCRGDQWPRAASSAASLSS